MNRDIGRQEENQESLDIQASIRVSSRMEQLMVWDATEEASKITQKMFKKFNPNKALMALNGSFLESGKKQENSEIRSTQKVGKREYV